MHKKRLGFDSLVILLSISLFTYLRVLFEKTFPTNQLNQGSIFTGFSVTYSIFLYFGIIIFYVLYGWSLRRWFIKKKLDEKDNSLKHVYLIFLILFLIILVNFLIVYFLPFNESSFYSQFAKAAFEILQITVISATSGILLYTQIEEHLGLLIFKEVIQAEERELGLGSFQRQVRYHSKKYWEILMVILGFVIMFSNLLLFLVYPSIPVTSEEQLTLFYPNFWYSYDPSTGFRQKFFDYTTIPSSIMVDWKLVQSIMCLLIFTFILLFIYLPSKKDNNSIPPIQDLKEPPKEEKIQEDIAFNILTPSVELKEYSASHQIKIKSQRRFGKFVSRAFNRDFIGIMGLLSFNFALSVVIIFIFQNIGILNTTQLQLDGFYDGLYIDLSQLFWAGFSEEITFRWMIFGLPLFLIYGIIYTILRLIKSRNQKREKSNDGRLPRFLNEIEKTNPLLYLIGGWKRFDFIGFIFLIFSSFAFGYVHYASGWDAWKIFQAGVAGVIFGYGYVKYGFHAAIFLHAANNFIIGYVITPNLGLIVNGELLFLILTFLGAFILLFTIFVVLSKFFKGMNLLFGRYNKDHN